MSRYDCNNAHLCQLLTIVLCSPVVNTDPATILPCLFLGSKIGANNKDLLKEKGVILVVNCTATSDVPNCHPNDFEYHNVGLVDSESEDIVETYKSQNVGGLIRTIRLAPNSLQAWPFFHCQMTEYLQEKESWCIVMQEYQGMASTTVQLSVGLTFRWFRSASIVLLYMMQYHKYSLRNAFLHVKEKRNQISPNRGFFAQLQRFELETHGGSVTFDMKEYYIQALVDMGFDRKKATQEFENSDGLFDLAIASLLSKSNWTAHNGKPGDFLSKRSMPFAKAITQTTTQ